MQIAGIDHFTVRCQPDGLVALKAFYRDVLGMTDGPRPDFDFPGLWMYVEGRALVHLAGTLPPGQPMGGSGNSVDAAAGFDHVSLLTQGLAPMREHLTRLSVSFYELPVPGWPLHQVFLHDPAGTKVELTFEGTSEPR